MEFIISDILVFTFAVFLLLVTPGPGVLSTAGVGSGFGSRAGLVYLIGLFLGTNLVALAVVGGYAALVFSIPYVRWVLMTGSFGYLLWLALKIAIAGRKLELDRIGETSWYPRGNPAPGDQPQSLCGWDRHFLGLSF